MNTREIVRTALDVLKACIHPYVLTQLKRSYGERAAEREPRIVGAPDVQALLSVVLDHWQPVFSKELEPRDRGLVHELKIARNGWAHEQNFSLEQAYRAIDTVELFLRSIGAAVPTALTDAKREIRMQQVGVSDRSRPRKTSRSRASHKAPALQHPSSPGRRGAELQGKRLRIVPHVMKEGNPRVAYTHGWLAFEVLRRAEGGSLTFEEYYRRLFVPSSEITKLADAIPGVPNAYQDVKHIRHDIAHGRVLVE
jgi:hypothetical protein